MNSVRSGALTAPISFFRRTVCAHLIRVAAGLQQVRALLRVTRVAVVRGVRRATGSAELEQTAQEQPWRFTLTVARRRRSQPWRCRRVRREGQDFERSQPGVAKFDQSTLVGVVTAGTSTFTGATLLTGNSMLPTRKSLAGGIRGASDSDVPPSRVSACGRGHGCTEGAERLHGLGSERRPGGGMVG